MLCIRTHLNLLGDFELQVGKQLAHGDDDYALRNWMESIDFVKTKFVDGRVVYLSEAPQHHHMTSMIRRQKRPRTFTNSRRNLNMSMTSQGHNASLTTPKAWANTLVFRRKQQSKQQIKPNLSSMDDTFKVPQTPRRTVRRPPTPRRPLPFSSQSSLNQSEASDDLDHNNNNITAFDSVSYMTNTNFEEPVSLLRNNLNKD